MLTKTRTILSALLVIGFAQAAMAGEYIEARIGDRYPLLEQRQPVVAEPAGTFAYASARRTVRGYTAAERQQFDRATAYVSAY